MEVYHTSSAQVTWMNFIYFFVNSMMGVVPRTFFVHFTSLQAL